MSDYIKINFLNRETTETTNSVNGEKSSPIPARIEPAVKPPKPKGRFKKFFALFLIVVFVGTVVLASTLAFSGNNFATGLSNLSLLGQVGNLITAGDRPVSGEDVDRINFLLTGIGGGDHDGGTLTDTMILLTFKPSTKQVAMISIPRDLYVKIPQVGWGRINAVNAYAENYQKGSGGTETAKFMNDLLGTTINYYAVIDFDGFEKLIDEFGGIDVTVDNDLIDYQYPIRGKENDYPISSRYETLKILKGPQHMDGATALKYARSRHAAGAEGSDFARSKRQQKVLLALKDKIMQYNFLMNPTKISSLMNAYSKNVQTNLQLWEVMRLGKLAKDTDLTNPINYSLVNYESPLIYDQMVNGSYVLLPYGGNFDKIKFVWENIFTIGTSTLEINKTKWAEFKDQATTTKATTTSLAATTTASTVTAPATFQSEKAKIEIRNGTLVAGWASKEAAKLKAKGFYINQTGNATARDYTAVEIYDFSGGNKPLTVSELQAVYGVSVSAPPSGLNSNNDIMIILGQ